MDRYGEAIEADLQSEYGLDLLDFFRGRFTWRKLMALLSGLDRHSRYGEALANDEEYAARVLDDSLAAPATTSGVRLREFTPQVELLTALLEGQGVIVSRLEQIAKYKNPHKPRPLPRPYTAFDKVRHAKANLRYTGLVEEVEQAQQRWLDRRET